MLGYNPESHVSQWWRVFHVVVDRTTTTVHHQTLVITERIINVSADNPDRLSLPGSNGLMRQPNWHRATEEKASTPERRREYLRRKDSRIHVETCTRSCFWRAGKYAASQNSTPAYQADTVANHKAARIISISSHQALQSCGLSLSILHKPGRGRRHRFVPLCPGLPGSGSCCVVRIGKG